MLKSTKQSSPRADSGGATHALSTVSDLSEDRGAGEGALSWPSISRCIPLGLSSGFHHVMCRFSHHPSVLGNSEKSIGLVTSRTEPKTASAAVALLLPSLAPSTAQPFHRPHPAPTPTPSPCSLPGPQGDRGGAGVGLSPGLLPAGGSGQTAACGDCRRQGGFSSSLLIQVAGSSALSRGR